MAAINSSSKSNQGGIKAPSFIFLNVAYQAEVYMVRAVSHAFWVEHLAIWTHQINMDKDTNNNYILGFAAPAYWFIHLSVDLFKRNLCASVAYIYLWGKWELSIVLYCIVLYCIVLYCIVLYCIVLYCIVQ